MCLVGWAYRHFDDYELIIAANRDEFQERPTQGLHAWPGEPTVLAGKDLEAGGTWLAVNRQGRLAAVTNFREGHRSTAPKSRGDLGLDFVNGDESAESFAIRISQFREEYGGFNLLLYDGSALWYSSNRGPQPRALPIGVGSLSNGDISNRWPKMRKLEAAFQQSQIGNGLRHQLLDALQDPIRPDESELPETGVSREWEKFLSPVFITGDQYGTRCSSLISISQREIVFHEVSYHQNGAVSGEQREVLARTVSHS